MTPKPSAIARTTHGQEVEFLDSICFTGSARRTVPFQSAVSTRIVGTFSSAVDYLVCPREARGMSERLSIYPGPLQESGGRHVDVSRDHSTHARPGDQAMTSTEASGWFARNAAARKPLLRVVFGVTYGRSTASSSSTPPSYSRSPTRLRRRAWASPPGSKAGSLFGRGRPPPSRLSGCT